RLDCYASIVINVVGVSNHLATSAKCWIEIAWLGVAVGCDKGGCHERERGEAFDCCWCFHDIAEAGLLWLFVSRAASILPSLLLFELPDFLPAWIRFAHERDE